MTTLLGCIADDFTGATDLAGLLARSGVRVSLRIGVPEEPPTDTAPFEVIALKCRTAPMAEAVGECRRALSWLKRAGSERFFWKYCSTFDSTPEGNIGPVAEALMADLGTAQTIYCPAFPENGRTVFMGNLFVGREPLAESPMRHHPLTPMRDSNLLRLLAPQVRGRVGLIDRPTVGRGADAVAEALTALASDGVANVVTDAVADEDLAMIARACREMTLLTGGSALAMFLPDLFRADGKLGDDATAPERAMFGAGAVVLSGSCSAMTHAQVEAYLKTGAPSLMLDPVKLADGRGECALRWLAEQDFARAPLVYATAAPDVVAAAQERLGKAEAGQIVEDTLAACALAAFDSGAERIVVAGGETSGAVTKALGVSRLSVGPEIAPGVPWCFAERDGRKLALALKSGNFGDADFFAKALDAA